ncbi:MAG: stage V sporulation protein AD [Bacilli bacterium]|nr:stage V sporulation protein AD [Bacilli bacterium]
MPSLKFNNVYINDFYSVAGPLEKVGQIRKFDKTLDDYYFGEKTFELAEIKMQKTVIENLLYKNKCTTMEIDCLIGGDLTNQIAASSYTARKFKIPNLGIYSACASFVEALIISANFIDSKKMKKIIALTSSHNLVAEKQFRFPVEYGAPKKKTSTFTATGSVGALVTGVANNIKIESATIGITVDLDCKDANHLGAAMAPAAADTIKRHLADLKRDVNYYDLILTGDLGTVGSKILLEYLEVNYNIKLKKHVDAGEQIFAKSQDVNAGASGPVSLPLVLFNKVLKNTKFKKILIVGTGALHSPNLLNQKDTIPAIAHAVSLEVL